MTTRSPAQLVGHVHTLHEHDVEQLAQILDGFREPSELDRLMDIVRDELLWALTNPADRAAITSRRFSSQATYIQGGTTFERGLFDWEEACLSSGLFPPTGHILVTAAGGGREVAALVDRGYTVSGFEPSGLVRGAQGVATGSQRAHIVKGSYADLVRAAIRGDGPLSPIVHAAPFDAVVLGWASLAHVHEREELAALFSVLRQLSPSGPVLMSFVEPKASPPHVERLRQLLRRLLAPSSNPSMERRYSDSTGFVTLHRATDLAGIARLSGYEVAHLSRAGYAHAVWVPTSSNHSTRVSKDDPLLQLAQ